jgi:hypothetical protein
LLLTNPRREWFSTVSVVGPGLRSASISQRAWLRLSAHLFQVNREESSRRASTRCCPSHRVAVESCIRCTNSTTISAFGAEFIEQWTQGATPMSGLTSGNAHTREDGSSSINCNSRGLQACKPEYAVPALSPWARPPLVNTRRTLLTPPCSFFAQHPIGEPLDAGCYGCVSAGHAFTV